MYILMSRERRSVRGKADMFEFVKRIRHVWLVICGLSSVRRKLVCERWKKPRKQVLVQAVGLVR